MNLSSLLIIGIACVQFSPLWFDSSSDVDHVKTSLGIEQELQRSIPDVQMIGNNELYSESLGLSLTGSELEGLEFVGNLFTNSTNAGEIRTFTKASGSTMENAIKRLLSEQGVDPSDCTIVKGESVEYTATGDSIWTVYPNEQYTPSEDEIYTSMKDSYSGYMDLTKERYQELCDTTPECAWKSDALLDEYNQKVCSRYAESSISKDKKFFQAEGDGTGTAFIHVHTQTIGGGSTWIGQLDVKK